MLSKRIHGKYYEISETTEKYVLEKIKPNGASVLTVSRAFPVYVTVGSTTKMVTFRLTNSYNKIY